MTPEERDARTIFVMQLSQRCRARDVEEFFSSVGKIRDVRLILCNKTRRFKGIAYVEFKDIESVALVRFFFSFHRGFGIRPKVQIDLSIGYGDNSIRTSSVTGTQSTNK